MSSFLKEIKSQKLSLKPVEQETLEPDSIHQNDNKNTKTPKKHLNPAESSKCDLANENFEKFDTFAQTTCNETGNSQPGWSKNVAEEAAIARYKNHKKRVCHKFKSMKKFQKHWNLSCFRDNTYPTKIVKLRVEEKKTLLRGHHNIFKDSIDERSQGDVEYLIGSNPKKDYTGVLSMNFEYDRVKTGFGVHLRKKSWDKLISLKSVELE